MKRALLLGIVAFLVFNFVGVWTRDNDYAAVDTAISTVKTDRVLVVIPFSAEEDYLASYQELVDGIKEEGKELWILLDWVPGDGKKGLFQFVRSAVERFGREVDVWVLGDKVNLKFSSPSIVGKYALADAYADEFKKAAAVIKLLDPTARIGLGSFAGFDLSAAEYLFERDVLAYADFVSLKLRYTAVDVINGAPEEDFYKNFRLLEGLAQDWDSFKDVYVLDVAFEGTQLSKVDDLEAALLSRVCSALYSTGFVKGVFYPLDAFGSGSKRKDYVVRAVAKLNSLFEGARLWKKRINYGITTPGEGVEVSSFVFVKGGKVFLAYWLKRGANTNALLNFPSSFHFVKAVNPLPEVFGGVEVKETKDGVVVRHLPLRVYPIFLEFIHLPAQEVFNALKLDAEPQDPIPVFVERKD